MYLNGVMRFSDNFGNRGVATDGALKLPYFAATAWCPKMLPADLQSKI
jgi:hypothetical protein